MKGVDASGRCFDMTILVVDNDAFRIEYVTKALEAAGAVVLSPVTTISQVRLHLDGSEDTPHAALVADDGTEADSLAILELLQTRGIPQLLLVGASGNPALYPAGTPILRVPFASYQVVDWALDLAKKSE
jgi:hypothetical protein